MQSKKKNNSGPKKLKKDCTIYVVAGTSTNRGNNADETFVCELETDDADGISGHSFPIELPEGNKQLREKLSKGELVSGATKFSQNPNVELSEGVMRVPPGVTISLNKKRVDRKLAVVTGSKPILVVRVNATDYDVADNAEEVSDNIFGTYGDPNNLASQMKDCSANQLEITNTYSVDISDKLAAPGVINVNLNIPLEESTTAQVRNAITDAVQTKLGFNLPGPFQHVMYVIRGCFPNNCPYAAYAYVNSWLSLYQRGYYKMTAVQVHEVGHNLNLAHSGMGGGPYSDHTCMVSTLFLDIIICMNNLISWQCPLFFMIFIFLTFRFSLRLL